MPIAVVAQGAAALPLCTLGGETVLPLMACKECGGPIYGWITYHEEWLQDDDGLATYHPYVAYCYECTKKDKAMTTEEKGTPWTLRARCAHWANNSSRCTNCWQSCRIQGGSTSHCLRYWGWGKSGNKSNWYCPKHVLTELGYQKPPDPDCECPKRWPWKDTPNVPHHLAAQQDATWVQQSGLLALGDDDAAALAEQWRRAAAAHAQGMKSPAGG